MQLLSYARKISSLRKIKKAKVVKIIMQDEYSIFAWVFATLASYYLSQAGAFVLKKQYDQSWGRYGKTFELF